MNDGSHSVHDDVYISADESVVARYLDVFQRIFVKSKHEAHYLMMMRAEPAEAAVPSIAPAIAGEAVTA